MSNTFNLFDLSDDSDTEESLTTPPTAPTPSSTPVFDIRYSSIIIYNPFYLPPVTPVTRDKKSLVLDLDETLIHSAFQPHGNHELVVNVDVQIGIDEFTNVNFYVQRRPFLTHFLKKVSEKYEVVIFTASQKTYAEKIIQFIDPEKKYIHHALYRDHCVRTKNGKYIKDLSRLGREMRNTIIVDNSPVCYSWQPENAIPIESWFDDKNDQALKELLPLLENLHLIYDVRWVLNS